MSEQVENPTIPSNLSAEELSDHFRSSFVHLMQERLRATLAGEYSIGAVGEGPGPDQAARAGLLDIPEALRKQGTELAAMFGEELLRYFRLVTECPENAHPEPAVPQEGEDLLNAEASEELDALVSQSVEDAETHHGSAIEAVTVAVSGMLGHSLEGIPLPWSPSRLFAAFTASLRSVQHLDQDQVLLPLYQIFAQEVVAHIDGPCLAFRDTLPSRGGSAEEMEERESSPPPASSDDGRSRIHGWRFRKVFLLPLVAVGLGFGAWRLGEYLASSGWGRSPQPSVALDWPVDEVENPPGEFRRDLSAQTDAPSEGDSGKTEDDALPPPLVEAMPAQHSLAEQRARRDILRQVKLTHFTWRIDPAAKTLIFDLSLTNQSAYAVKDIEIVCSQYSDRLDELETAKVVLAGPLGSRQSRRFKNVQIGFGSGKTARVNCLVADVVIEPAGSDGQPP